MGVQASPSGATVPAVTATTSRLTAANRWDHILARWGVDRMGHRVEPGLYALGSPDGRAPVLVTANYAMSFDVLRSSLSGRDCYILVLDTRGINVWCAAGKGTFGTDELVHRIEATGLADIVEHRTLVLPQLGATGVSAHDVRRRAGFRVEYGPVRAPDLPAYLESGRATPAMRRVTFGLRDRLVVAPVDLVHALLPTLGAAIVLFLLGGALQAGAVVAAVLAGVILFPALLPWLPTANFSTKGFALGAVVALPFALSALVSGGGAPAVHRFGSALAYLLAMPPVTAYLALDFTGSTTFTSRSGVEREIRAYVPAMAWLLGCGVALAIALRVAEAIGGA